MAIGGSKSPVLAAVLSGVLPGLGQFYNREWVKGAGFLVGFLILDGALGVSADLVKFFFQGVPPENTGGFLVRSLVVLALALWSILEAVRSARGRQ